MQTALGGRQTVIFQRVFGVGVGCGQGIMPVFGPAEVLGYRAMACHNESGGVKSHLPHPRREQDT